MLTQTDQGEQPATSFRSAFFWLIITPLNCAGDVGEARVRLLVRDPPHVSRAGYPGPMEDHEGLQAVCCRTSSGIDHNPEQKAVYQTPGVGCTGLDLGNGGSRVASRYASCRARGDSFSVESLPNAARHPTGGSGV